MANGAFKFKDNSGNVVSFISGSGSNISFSGGTLDLSGMTGLTLGNLTLSGTTQNALSASHAASYLLTSSFNTYSGTTDTVIGTLQTSTSSLNTFTSSATTRLNSIEGVSGSYATTGSNLFKGNQTISGSIIPAVDNAYDLGSVTHQFRDLYLSSASLYIDGTKVLGSTAQELQITTDTGQSFKILEAGSDNITLQSADGNIELKSSGGGDVILDPTTGVIALKGTTTLYAGNKILSSDGNAIQIGNSATITGSLVVTGFIETQELRTTYISSSILYRSGSTKFGDELSDTHSFTGSLSVSGTINVPGSGLISGSSQVLNGSGVFSGSAQLPSGIVSSSAQTIANLPSGTVSGSVQVDVMSTTNIAQLATTGSNVFTGALTGTSATFSSNISAGTTSTSGGDNIISVTNGGGTTYSTRAILRSTVGGIGAELRTVYGANAAYMGTTTASDLYLITNDTAKVTILNNGKVGIGETTPDNTYQGLTIKGSDPSLRLKTTGGSGWTWIEFVNSSGTNNFSMGVNQTTPTFVIKAGAGLDGPNFSLSSAGAATFSSTIASAGDITITKASDASFIANNTSESGKSYRLVSTNSGTFVIQNTGILDLVTISSTGAVTAASDGVFGNSRTGNNGGGTVLNIMGSSSSSTSSQLNLTQVWNGVQYPIVLKNIYNPVGGAASSIFTLSTTQWNGSTALTTERFRVDGSDGVATFNGAVNANGGATITGGNFNINSSNSATYATIQMSNNASKDFQQFVFGSGRGDVYFGQAAANWAVQYTTAANGLMTGTYNNTNYIIGTNNTARLTFANSGGATFSTNVGVGSSNNAGALTIYATDARKLSIEADNNVRNTRLFKAYSVAEVSETWCRIRLENNYAQNYQGVWGTITVAYHPYHASRARFYQYNFIQGPYGTNNSYMKIMTVYEEVIGWDYYSFASDVQFYNFENYLYIKVIGQYGGVNQIRSVTADLTGGNVAMDSVQLEVNVAAPARLGLITKNAAAVLSA
jgi:hypothetical protein